MNELNRFSLQRRQLLAAVAASTATVATPQAWSQNAGRVLRVGHQKGWLSILKGRGTLEKRLAPLGVKVTWTEFNAGPVQLEALNVGSIDFGDVGEAPPIFAQAAGAPLVYIGATVPRPALEAVIVPSGSPIRSVADLKGKRVAYNKGSNVQYFLVKLLEKNGLKYGDVQSIFLAPADARAAFERGAIDAWIIWDPFLAAAHSRGGARQRRGVVKGGQHALADGHLRGRPALQVLRGGRGIARRQAQHQTGPLVGAAMVHRIDAERPSPAVEHGGSSVYERETGPPHQRSVSEHPAIFAAAL